MAFTWGSALRIALLLLLMAAVATACFTLPVEKILKDFLLWVEQDLGPWGPLVLAVAYIPLTVLAVPASVLTLGGGYLFGLPVGFVADSIGATLGAGAAFLLGRTEQHSCGLLSSQRDEEEDDKTSSYSQSHSGYGARSGGGYGDSTTGYSSQGRTGARSCSGYGDSTDYSGEGHLTGGGGYGGGKTDDYSEEGHGGRATYSETTAYSSEGRRTGGGGYDGASNTDSYSEEGHGGRATETTAFCGEGRRTGGGGYSDNTDYSGEGRHTRGGGDYGDNTDYFGEGRHTSCGGGYGGVSTDDYSEEGHGGRRGYKKSDDDDDSEEGHGGRGRGGYSKRSETNESSDY